MATAIDGPIAGVHVGTAVVDGAGFSRIEIDARHRLGELATLLADRIERDVVGVRIDLVLVLRENVACAIPMLEDEAGHGLELAGLVQVRVRDELDRRADRVGAVLNDRREVVAVGLTAPERVRDVGVGRAEVATERAGVDLAEVDQVPLEVTEGSRELPEGVAVVGGEDLPDLVAPIPKHFGDEIPAHDLVDVARWGTPDGEMPPLTTIGSSGSRFAIRSATVSAQNACRVSLASSRWSV